MDFSARFKGYVRTATPLVLVHTFDARATIRNIIETLEAAKDGAGKTLLSQTGLSQWDCCRGLRGVNDLGIQQIKDFKAKAEVPEDALYMAENLYKILAAAAPNVLRDHFTFVLNAHKYWGANVEVQGLWNLRDVLKEKGSMVILLASPGATLPEEIAQDVMYLDEPLPNEKQVEAIITSAYESAKKVADANDKKIPKTLAPAVMKQAVAAVNGLPMFPIEQSSSLCIDSQTGNVDVEEMWGQKRQTISQRPGLSMYEGTASLDNLDDLDNVTDFLKRYDAGPESPNVILRFDEMEKAFAGSGTDLSGDATKLTGSILSWFQDKRINGIIFLGVPGCGKSELLYAWAKDAKKPVINVDLPGMQGSLLGQSMANLQAAEKTIDAMGGGRVLAIATVNDVSTLPAPLLRRFNLGIFFFDIPRTPEARLKILNIHRKKYHINPKDTVPDMHLWTGSDIENACKRAYMLNESLTDSAKNVVQVMRARRAEMEALRRGADSKYISASTPGIYQYYDPYEETVAAPVEGGRRLKG